MSRTNTTRELTISMEGLWTLRTKTPEGATPHFAAIAVQPDNTQPRHDTALLLALNQPITLTDLDHHALAINGQTYLVVPLQPTWRLTFTFPNEQPTTTPPTQPTTSIPHATHDLNLTLRDTLGDHTTTPGPGEGTRAYIDTTKCTIDFAGQLGCYTFDQPTPHHKQLADRLLITREFTPPLTITIHDTTTIGQITTRDTDPQPPLHAHLSHVAPMYHANPLAHVHMFTNHAQSGTISNVERCTTHITTRTAGSGSCPPTCDCG